MGIKIGLILMSDQDEEDRWDDDRDQYF